MRIILMAVLVAAVGCGGGDEPPTEADKRELVTCTPDWGPPIAGTDRCEAPCEETITGGDRCTLIEPQPNTTENDLGRYNCNEMRNWEGLRGCCFAVSDPDAGVRIRWYECR